MRFIITIIWALLISSALAYVLSSMGGDVFNVTQAIGLAVSAFVIILILDGVLTVSQRD